MVVSDATNRGYLLNLPVSAFLEFVPTDLVCVRFLGRAGVETAGCFDLLAVLAEVMIDEKKRVCGWRVGESKNECEIGQEGKGGKRA